MSVDGRNEILELLKAYPAGQVYAIAPKQYVIRGYEYYRSDSLKYLEWNRDFSMLSTKVSGTKLYSVDFFANGKGLNFSCNCPAWSPYSNCKHVVCGLMTLKNLLQPETFSRGIQHDKEHKDYLLRELFSNPAASNLKEKGNEIEEEKKEEYSIVIDRTNRFANIYIRKNGKTASEFSPDIPFELRRLIGQTYYSGYTKLLDFSNYLRKTGHEYPFILKTHRGEEAYSFDSRGVYSCRTELNAAGEFVSIRKICLRDNTEIRNPLFEYDFVFDTDEKIFGIIKSKVGWMYWNDFLELNYSFRIDYSTKDYDNYSFQMPAGTFTGKGISFPASEGVKPEHLTLKIEGRETEPVTANTSYRLTIEPSADGRFTIKAECLLDIDSLKSSTFTALFGFFSLTNKGLNASLRAHKRKDALIKTFIEMLSAESKTKAEEVIKKALTGGNFQAFRVKQRARAVLKDHLAIFLNKENNLFLHNGKWISVAVDKRKQLQLYKILFEIFGWTIFNDIPEYNQMVVQPNDLYEKLPVLYERAKEENIELFFNNLQVSASQWDFSFEASRTSGIDWFEIRPEIRCNGQLVDDASFLEMLRGKGAVVKDGCIQIMDSDSKKTLEAISEMYGTGGIHHDRKKEIVNVPRLQILDWIMLRSRGVRIKLPPEDEQIIQCLTSFEKIEPKPLPSKLKAKLRQYQKEGYYWLGFLYENMFGACLADDMGLGKTVQAISLLAGIAEGIIRYPLQDKAGPNLIVLPPSLLFNWESEINRFCPGMKMIHYTGRERSTSFEDAEVVLTTYGLVRRDIDKLKELRFNVIIFDEAQAIKNIFADTTGAVRQLKARFKLTMTGTPLENHIGEYYSIIDLGLPGLLGEFDDFRPLIKQEVSKPLDVIIRRTKPFVLRRTKETILKELPPKTETDIYLDLTEKQKALYKKTVEQVRTTIDDAYRTKTNAQAQIIALTAILKLRQLCVSPQLIDPEIKEPSPKIDFLIDNLKELLKGEHSALVFSQFTSFLDILQKDMKKQGLDFLRLDGSTPVGKRKKLVEKFQSAEEPSVFLLSLKAGGQGLNLTKASYVFHLDPWWNPAVENQASDRAHRIGQKNKVTITRILMRHTIEEKMMVLKKKKLELYKAVMDDSTISKRGLSISKSDFNFLLG